ncbi:FAD-dependent 5-carboxymethylaminomethyl-2-thiouridine(34) oxidoreductase MnmC [Massilia sp. Dwa41.01b]|uniref:FAD-dependent 5-carboxymethylaminomethyl-2-thiouridine(34) oxidoreductase MnmC n=1 Tax=Massilia sp. Dwa41.01b TaxID=2709302 RepID=UPI00280546E2|nr:FAD-dependent 5-carboxymethylaminomethyl-2-thiouridine(34) oxidoreductase MnmC [Massilia sp. Dwa41.01b]
MNPADCWQGRERYTVFDTRHEPGAVAALIAAWRADPARPARLHIVALATGLLPGFHRIPQVDAAVTFDLVCAPLEEALAQLSARIDYVQLRDVRGQGGAFARGLARLVAADARLSAEGLDAEQRAALAAQGFVFEGGSGTEARARFASRKPRLPLDPVPARHAIVIGAGLAGCAAAHKLCARGWQVTLVERHAGPARGASGNLAGIFMPILSKDDNIPTRLTRAAYLYALRYWETIGGIGRAIEGAACGVLQLARDGDHAEASRAIAADGTLPPEFAEWLEAPQAGALLGLPAPLGAWLFRQGGWARPGSVCEAMLDACGTRLTRRFGVGEVSLARDGEAWTVRGAGGDIVASAATVVLAGGAESVRLAQAQSLPLAALRGQVTHLDAATLPRLPFVLCREAYLTPAAGGIACAGATYDSDADPDLRATSQQENVARLRVLVSDPDVAADAPLAGRVGFRSVAPDRLPLVGALPDVAARAAPNACATCRAIPACTVCSATPRAG